MFPVTPYLKKHQTIHDLYVDKGLSASQVAAHVGHSKTWVFDRLKQLGISIREDRRANPRNYRLPYAPYGYSIREGCLVLNRREIKVCRLVIEWRERGQKSFREIARLLVRHGHKNRRGQISWNNATICNIYKRWRGKL